MTSLDDRTIGVASLSRDVYAMFSLALPDSDGLVVAKNKQYRIRGRDHE